MIFLSHSWKDKPAARKLVEALAEQRVPCWLDEQQLDEGAELRASLRAAISQSDVYLYLISHSANQSEWVQYELKFALGLEGEEKLRIVPVRLADNNDPLPSLLRGRFYGTLEPTSGGAARLAHKLSELEGHSRIPDHCRLSATVRLEECRIMHTLAETRELASGRNIDVDVLLLNSEYEAMDSLYWNVAEVQFSPVSGTLRELESVTDTIENTYNPREVIMEATPQNFELATEIVAATHDRSRRTIRELRMVCRRFLTTVSTDGNLHYFDAGHERIMRVLLHQLQWDSTYLLYLRDHEGFGEEFIKKRHLPKPFDGHKCDFVSGDQELGSTNVPKHGHPWPDDIEAVSPWGLRSPFNDLFKDKIGVAVGDILARRFMAQTLQTTELPSPNSLTYGLS